MFFFFFLTIFPQVHGALYNRGKKDYQSHTRGRRAVQRPLLGRTLLLQSHTASTCDACTAPRQRWAIQQPGVGTGCFPPLTAEPLATEGSREGRRGLQVCFHSRLHWAPVGSSDPMLTQMVPAKLKRVTKLNQKA